MSVPYEYFVLFQSGCGLNECEQVLSTQGSVTALSVDLDNGAIIAGIQDLIRWDHTLLLSEKKTLVILKKVKKESFT